MGAPTGSDLCVGTTDAGTLVEFGSGFTEREIDFTSPVELENGENYSIVARALTAADFDSVYWHMGTAGVAGLPYYSDDSGSSWNTDSGDMWYTLKGGTLKENFTATLSGAGLLSSWAFAQTFAAASSYDLGIIGLKLSVSSAPGGVSGGIYATLAGKPTGGALATFSFTALTGTATWRYAVLSSEVSLINTTVYAIVLDGEAGELVYWQQDDNVGSNAYAGGAAYFDLGGGGGWVDFGSPNNYDFGFKCYEIENKDLYNPSGSNTGNDIYNVEWNAQSFTPTSTYPVSSVVLELSRWIGADPNDLTVSIKAALGDPPTKATTPAPANAATDVTLDQATLTWVDGGGADTYNVYYGDTSGDLTKVSDAQEGLSYTITDTTLGSPFEYLVTRYWRIDSTNAIGTTTGDEWSFTTIRLDPPTQTYFYSTTGQYYQLLVQSDGSYGDPPGVGVEDTDYVFLTAGYEANFISTTRKLIAVANSKVWYEDI